MHEIINLKSILDQNELKNALVEIETIFYEASSLKEFSSPERKAAFFKRWCGDYINLFPEDFWIFKVDGKILGYLSGCTNSSAAKDILEVPGFKCFEDLFSQYPAHLHINFDASCRGKGYGSILMNFYCASLMKKNIYGVHLITSVGAHNISFYQRLGFDNEIQREFNQMTLLFMGKILK